MDTLRVERGEVAVVTFENAERMNSFDPALLQHMHGVFTDLLADDDVRAIVLTGTGKAFSTGADVAQFRKGIDEGSVVDWILAATEHLHPMLEALHFAHKPFIAAVNGVAAGGGLGLALAADARIGTDQARFAAGYFGIGASPDGGATWLMPRLIGLQRTRRFFMDNQIMGADEALQTGLMDAIVPAEALVDEAVAMAKRWGAAARHSREATKRLLSHSLQNDFGAHLDMERGLIAAAGGTADFAEGVDAFLRKRKPAFR